MALSPLNSQSLKLAASVSAIDTTFRTVGRFESTNAGTYTVGQQIIVLSPGTTSEERMYINVTVNPTEIDATTGIYEYTIITRGLDSDNKAVPPTLTSTDMQFAHTRDSTVAIVVTAEYFSQLSDQFESATVSESMTNGSGEAFSAREQLSLHTDGLYYKYLFATYPNWAGTALTAATGAAETFTLAKPGYQVTGYAGLTIGAPQYAEDTGATTETPSATTAPIGKSESASQILLQSSAPDISEASEAQARAGTVQAVYNSPLRTYQAIQEGEATYAVDAEASDTYVIALTPAPAAYSTGMQVKFLANTANTGAATINANTIGAKAITKNGTDALENGDIAAGQVVTAVYDGTQFQLQTPSSALVNPSGVSSYIFTQTVSVNSGTTTHTENITLAHGLGATPTIVQLSGIFENNDGSGSIVWDFIQPAEAGKFLLIRTTPGGAIQSSWEFAYPDGASTNMLIANMENGGSYARCYVRNLVVGATNITYDLVYQFNATVFGTSTGYLTFSAFR